MDLNLLRVLVIIGLPFGIIGGIMAYLNAYDGYSHFPAISRRKKIRLALEMAIAAFIMTMVACALVFFFVRL